MPGFNQTGPKGLGSKTGRGMGKCTNFGAELKTQTIEIEEQVKEINTENMQGARFGLGRGRAMGVANGKCFGMGQQHRFRGGR